ncbi:uncharacterized protein LOC131438073 [Malaya genurostris]|uniref:uncharacterized protein LOC131438073 n=1 Tax=Malaya genurostris TaxID=325434 RepID=UPI0026F3FCD8|nr:uncharacterized protein LOC131438073 [Malaya genurostris]
MNKINLDNTLVNNDRTLVPIESEHSLRQGECFDSYEQFVDRLERHSANDLVYYWRRDSRTIGGAALKTARPIATALRYYSVRYSCIFGGQRFTTKSTGIKKVRSSLRSDCPAYIALRASKCGQQLVVKATSNVHNHEITREVTKNLSHNKKLSAEMKQKVLVLLFHNVDKKLIREYVRVKEGKELTIKDLFNLAATMRKKASFEQSFDVGMNLELSAELKEYVNKNSSNYLKSLTMEQSTKQEEINCSLQSDEAVENIEMLEERLLDYSDDDTNVNVNHMKDDGFMSISNQYNTIHKYDMETLEDTSDEPVKPEKTIKRKRTRWKSAACFSCGSNIQLVRAQLDILRARKNKLQEETQLLRLKKQKLQLELRAIKRKVQDLKK